MTPEDYARRGELVSASFMRTLTDDEARELEALERRSEDEQAAAMAPTIAAMEARVARMRKLAADIRALRDELESAK